MAWRYVKSHPVPFVEAGVVAGRSELPCCFGLGLLGVWGFVGFGFRFGLGLGFRFGVLAFGVGVYGQVSFGGCRVQGAEPKQTQKIPRGPMPDDPSSRLIPCGCGRKSDSCTALSHAYPLSTVSLSGTALGHEQFFSGTDLR